MKQKSKLTIFSVLLLIVLIGLMFVPNIYAANPSITYVSKDTFMPKNNIIFDQSIVGSNTTIQITNASNYTTKILSNTYSGSLNDVIYKKDYFFNYASCGGNTFIVGKSSDWLVAFPSGLNSNTQIIVNYPYVGMYNGVQIGCKLYISNIAEKPKGYTDWNYASFHIARDIYRGIRFQNVESADYAFEFYRKDTGSVIQLSNTIMSFSSLNKYSIAAEKVAPLTTVKNIYAIQNSNITTYSLNGLTYYGGGSETGFTDLLGHANYTKNSVSFQFAQNIKVNVHTEYSSMAFTFDPTPITISEPVTPTKQVNKTSVIYKANEELEYRIGIKIHTLGIDTYEKYTSLVIKDVLPTGVTYVSSSLKNENNQTVSKGTANYDSSTKTVTYTFSSENLSSSSFYNGATYYLVINVKVNNDTNTDIVNTSYLVINGKQFNSNQVTSKINYKITTEVENGKIDNVISDITKGSNKTIKYSANSGYVLKSIIVDGVEQNINMYSTQYLFSNINTNHHIKVIYELLKTDITLKLTKIWNDENNKYFTRPNSLNITVYQNGINFKTYTLTESNKNANNSNIWELNIDVPEKDSNGNLYKYTIREDENNRNLVYYYQEPIYDQDNLTVTNTAVWLPVNPDDLPEYMIIVNKEIINNNNQVATQQDYEKIKLNINTPYQFPIILKELNKTLSAGPTSMLENYSGYSGNEYHGIITNKGSFVFSNIKAGKYEISEGSVQYFDFVGFTKLNASDGVTFSQENDKYYITISGFTETDECVEVKVTNRINSDRFYNNISSEINIFKVRNPLLES